MTLDPGTRLGPYEILSPIGAGGMGEVYKARDTRLGREVAVKVLPAAYSRDPDRLRRFEQEARAAGSLNHPNILTIHDVGTHEGAPYLVSELLEGETLRERLTRDETLAPRKAVDHALQVARGLAAAHDKAIVHRDLKPENLFLTRSGVIKILDFGLAKLIQAGPGGETVSSAPTVTRPGVVLGTAGYMSPEQVRGEPSDHRSDIFSFGAILYEMLSGQQAFAGQTAVESMNAILKMDPPEITASPGLDRVIRHCLEKASADRFQSAQDLAFALEAATGDSGTAAPAATPGPAGRRRAWMMAAAMLVIGALLAVIALSLRPAPSAPLVRFALSPPEKSSLAGTVALSPDGRSLVLVAVGSHGKTSLWLRDLDSLKPRELAGTDDAAHPFWSPDGRAIGFFAEGKLKTVQVAGGAPLALCDVSDARGGAWNRDGVILFAPHWSTGLSIVPASGGAPRPVTTLDASRKETTHRWPQFLPDGRRFLYFTWSGAAESRGIYAGSLDSKQTTRILTTDRLGFYAEASGKGGYLLFLRGETLMSQPFDARRLQLSGEPAPVGEQIWQHGSLWGLVSLSASAGGVLAYRTGDIQDMQLMWYDREGKPLGAVGPPGGYSEPALSPDEKRVAVTRLTSEAPAGAIWIVETSRGTVSRFSFGAASYFSPTWSPDGSRIAYSSDREGLVGAYVKSASGAGREEPLFRSASGAFQYIIDWSPDGRYVLSEQQGSKGSALLVLPLASGSKPFVFLEGDFNASQSQFSPDGKWIAYTSNESGRHDVFVQSFTGAPGAAGGGKWQVSNGGGAQPRWRRDGKELFYLGPDRKLMAVEVKGGATFESGPPRPLFQTQVPGLLDARNHYVASADGRRFLVITPLPDAAAAPITVVLNWTAGLKP